MHSEMDWPPVVSEQIEPALACAFSLCMRQLIKSERKEDDWKILYHQTRAIDRVVIGLMAYAPMREGPRHASVAAGNLVGKVDSMLRWPLEERNKLLDELREYM